MNVSMLATRTRTEHKSRYIDCTKVNENKESNKKKKKHKAHTRVFKIKKSNNFVFFLWDSLAYGRLLKPLDCCGARCVYKYEN